MPSETVLVTDGEQRAALAIVRSLGRHGYRVVVGSSRARSLAGASRYAARSVRFRNPLENPARYADEVLEAAHREAAHVVLPVTDHSLMAILPRRADFGAAVIPFPDAPLHAELSDKARVMEAARELGIQVPGQQVLTSAAAAARREPPLPAGSQAGPLGGVSPPGASSGSASATPRRPNS